MFKRNSSNVLQTVLLLMLIFVSSSIGLAQDARLIAKNIFPSLVMLEMRDDKNRPITLGSDFFVRPDVVVTNYHVIEGASDGVAKIVGKTSIYHIEGVVGIDKAKDLALLKLTGVSGKPLILADISKIEVGQEVFALGNPKGLEGTISAGIISGSSLRQVENENLIQITAPISPGSSGGPVVNREGQVIGVAVSSLKGGQNLNFAIPSSYLALLLANSKSVMPLSDATQVLLGKKSLSSEPSFAETSAWLTSKLVAKAGMRGGGVLKIESLEFDTCSMTMVTSYKKASQQRLISGVVKWNTFDHGSPVESSEQNIILVFSNDAVWYRGEVYEEGRLVNKVNYTDGIIMFGVGDKQTGLRVIKAFEHLAKLCKENQKKEPF